MKEVSSKLEEVVGKAVHSNKYQSIISILFLFQFACSQFFTQALPYLEARPFAFVNGKPESEQLTNEICKNADFIYIIDKTKVVSSIIIDFGIYCDEFRISLISLFFYGGAILGSCFSYLFADKIGRRKTLLIFTPLHSIILIIFIFLEPNTIKYTLNFVYIILFLLGISSNIIIVVMIIYICEIIKVSDVPFFVTIIITGMPLSGYCSSSIFILSNLNWRQILFLVGIINLVIFFLMLYLLIGSPIFFLNNEQNSYFIKYLIQISLKNGNNLGKDDFDFLTPYMSSNDKRKTLGFFGIRESLSESTDEKDINIIDNDNDLAYSFRDEITDNSFKIFSSSPVPENQGEKKQMINDVKEDYLNEDKWGFDKPYTSLFGQLKMKDYSPLDLFRFQSQTINFLILSYLWGISIIIKNGINLNWKKFPEYRDNHKVSLLIYFLEIIAYFFIYHTFSKKPTNFQKLLVSIQLLSFVFLMIGLYFCQNLTVYIVLLSITKLTCTCMFLLLFIITSLIYPIMIRTKGLGFNLATGTIGSIITAYLVEYLDVQSCLQYFLVFGFFSLVLSFGLPKKIGGFVLDVPSSENMENMENESLNNSFDKNYRKKSSLEIILGMEDKYRSPSEDILK